MKSFNKFRIGDTIVHNNGYRGPYQITSINEHGYELDNSGFRIVNVADYHIIK